jgi:raffinose/stachyose/melibiose transport system permease protein
VTLSVLTGRRSGNTEPPAAPVKAAGGGSLRRRKIMGWVTILSFLAPALLLFCLLVLAPIVFALYTSLYKWGGFGPPTNFVGLGNYTKLFGNEIFLGDLWHGLVLVFLSLVVQLPFALALAVLLNQRLRGRAVYRLVFFAPYVLAEAITAVLFSMIFMPGQGLADQLLTMVGLGDLGVTWFASPSTVLITLFLVITWKYFGFHMILYVAGLQGIPSEVLEAASIDGAGSWQRFRYVTLPLLGPTIRISAFLSVIGALQLFDLVWVISEGGPVHASETMAVTMFQVGFKRFQIGDASAISVTMFLISFVFALFYQRFVLRRDTEGAVTAMRGQV